MRGLRAQPQVKGDIGVARHAGQVVIVVIARRAQPAFGLQRNQRRAAGATCGQYGKFAPAGTLKMNPALRCAGRKHDKDMIAKDFFSHTGSNGSTPWDRIKSAGYGNYTTAGENIAAGQTTPGSGPSMMPKRS